MGICGQRRSSFETGRCTEGEFRILRGRNTIKQGKRIYSKKNKRKSYRERKNEKRTRK
jgi:hypothetical protein